MPDEAKENKVSELYEAVQLITGEVYIFRNGFKEESDKKDVFRFEAGINQAKQVVFNFSRFDFNPAPPVDKVRLNRAVIAFAWYVDPNSDTIRALKDNVIKMDAAKAGLILPGAG